MENLTVLERLYALSEPWQTQLGALVVFLAGMAVVWLLGRLMGVNHE